MTLYLSRLILNPLSRQVQSELAYPYEMHRTLQKGFNSSRQSAELLYHVDENQYRQPILLIQSNRPPDWTHLDQRRDHGGYLLVPAETKPITPHFSAEQRLHFRLRANPTTKKVRRNEQGEHKNSQRLALYKEEEQLTWLHHQAQQHGFTLNHTTITHTHQLHDPRHHFTIHTTLFEGTLTITDPTRFQLAHQKGIGPAKAFGCGLLALARP